MGKESGGDLDTVASNVFYAVWAQNHLKEVLGREPVYGQDYAFDFVNYSEGLFHLVIHRGSDIYLPDFPIDALVPRIKMILVTEEEAIKYLNEFTHLFTEYRRWIADYSAVISPGLKAVSNQIFLQYSKVIEHQESAAIKAGNNLIYLFYNLAYLNIVAKTTADPALSSVIGEWVDQIIQAATGADLDRLRGRLSGATESRTKQDLIDIVLDKKYDAAAEKRYILALLKAAEEDSSTHWQIENTPALLILAVETVAYAIRGLKQIRELRLDQVSPKLTAKITEDIESVRAALKNYFTDLINMTPQTPMGDEGVESAIQNIRTCLHSLVEITEQIKNPRPPESKDGLVPVRLMVMYEASGIAVSNIEIVVRRLEGSGAFVLPDGTEDAGPEVCQVTDRNGLIEVFYRPASPDEAYRFSATFDEMNHIYFPSEINPDAETSGAYVEEETDAFADPEGIDRAMKVSLDLMEREIKFLKDHDITIAAIDDHHPYTPAILNKLQELKEQGYIGHIKLSSLPRGEELPVDRQKCGADLIYEQYVQGKPWDNGGLSKLRNLAHCQDLAIERIDLAMQLSRVIGLKHSKIDMVLTLARTLKDEKSADQVMSLAGWASGVKSFDGKLSKVLPLTEQAIGHIVLGCAGEEGEERRIHILAVLPPFSDPQINVASAMGYLLGGKKYPCDYFFYCYDSSMLQMRKSNKEDFTFDLSLLAQHLGCRADGGHSGAATCRPDQNPAFPRRIFSKINDLNFLQYLWYIGERIASKCGLDLIGVMPPDMQMSDEQNKILERMHENSLKLELTGPNPKSDRIFVLFVKAPDKTPDTPVSYLHVYNDVRRRTDVHYLVYCQTGLNSIVIHNVNDPAKRLNVDRLAKGLGWSEDAGTEWVGIASGRLSKYIPRKSRWLNKEDIYRLCDLFGLMTADQSGYTIVGTVPNRMEFLNIRI